MLFKWTTQEGKSINLSPFFIAQHQNDMAAKHSITGIFSVIGAGSLSAQSTSAILISATGVHESSLGSIISQIEQNALMVLTGMVVLMVAVWVVCIWNACTGMNSKPKNIRVPSLSLWLLVAGLSVLGSSCTTAQYVKAGQIYAAQAAERGSCLLSNHHEEAERHAFNNRNPSHGYSNWFNTYTCNYCGQRVCDRH